MSTSSKPRGRPDQGYSERVDVKHTPEQRSAWERAAELEGSTLSDWIRRALDHASGLAERRIKQAARRAK